MRRRDAILDIPSVGDPCGEGFDDPLEKGIRTDDPEDCELGIICSDNAVVAVAFAVPDEPANGIRAVENFDDDDCREARDPGRRVPETLGAAAVLLSCEVDAGPLRAGEGGGGDELGNGDASDCGERTSGVFSACASKRDNDEGALGEDPGRGGDGNSLEVGGRVTVNDSSTSASGGPAGVSGAISVAGTGSSDEVVFLCEMRRLDGWAGCVQSSTSNM